MRSELVGEKKYGDVPGPAEKVSEEISPGPSQVLLRLSAPTF